MTRYVLVLLKHERMTGLLVVVLEELEVDPVAHAGLNFPLPNTLFKPALKSS